MRQVLLGAVPLLLAAGLLASAEEKKADARGQALFNGKDLTGWHGLKTMDPTQFEALGADEKASRIPGGVMRYPNSGLEPAKLSRKLAIA